MKYKYRIIENELGYYAQVNKGWWIFSWWMRIAKHTDGYGLYPKLGNPRKTFVETEEFLKDYVLFESRSRFKQVRVSYTEYWAKTLK